MIDDLSILRLVVFTLATARATRILVTDLAGEPIRVLASRHHPLFTLLLECPFCIGFWLSIPAAALALHPTPLADLAALALAISYAVGHVESRLTP